LFERETPEGERETPEGRIKRNTCVTRYSAQVHGSMFRHIYTRRWRRRQQPSPPTPTTAETTTTESSGEEEVEEETDGGTRLGPYTEINRGVGVMRD
jgi:hypothetical protein